MRSALLCVFFALVGKGGRQAGAVEDFKPMPIPLDDWKYGYRGSRAGTLHETARTAAPPAVAALPAHYWEDALRHSVYLTLVRDKIDQLISKGAVISPDTKPDQFNSKDIEDYDLWDKVKSAPFDRLSNKELNSFGDVTVMAKGRLLEEDGGFRFVEDERTNEKCNDESCMKGVRAIWSVKRVRQRDEEVSPGKYHYELTFSVMSQMTKKQRKPYENSVRTFTVRENPPEHTPEPPSQRQHSNESNRPQRAIWFHKNLTPHSGSPSRRYQTLERIFMSLFSDDDETPKARPPSYVQHQQLPKAPYVGSSTEQHQQKQLLAFPYNPPVYKYVRQPISPKLVMPHLHYADSADNLVKDQRYVQSNVHKTTRPAVLPTPLPEIENFDKDKNNDTETSTKEAESATPVHKIYTKPKPAPTKVNYLPGHLRPPVYNAPPGVFVTMDKKPFKPLPPLKIHTYKHQKHRDFRPSPQLLDMQFSDPESYSSGDTAFRPIIPNQVNQTSSSGKKGDKKSQVTNKRPPKKHGNIKAKPVTTSAPDIITVYNDDLDGNTDYGIGGQEWTNIVSSFAAVTTPIRASTSTASTVDITETQTTEETADTEETIVESSTPTPEFEMIEETTVNYNHNKKKRVITTPPTTTTLKPKRRTRPPPTFTKPEKPKKPKRITTTTKAPVKQVKSPVDLTPLASSAATKPNKIWEPKNKTVSTTTEASKIIATVSNTTPSTTTRATTTTSTTTAKPAPSTTAVYSTQRPTPNKNKNRFRQSTLMQKGTSVNHDKWSSINTEKDKNKTIVPPTGFPRRKASNFQGHASSTIRSIDVDHKEEDHRDNKFNMEDTNTVSVQNSTAGQTTHEVPLEHDSSHHQQYTGENNKNENERNSNDEKEYIFDLTSPSVNEKTNEISDAEDAITEETVTTPVYSVPKNKTKCKKKKKHENLMSMEQAIETSTLLQEPVTTAKSTTTTDIFTELFGDTHYDETTENIKESESELVKAGSENHEQLSLIDDEVHDYLDQLSKSKHEAQEHNEHYDSDSEDQDEVQYEDEDENETTDDFSPFNNTNEDVAPRDIEDDDDTYEDDYKSVSFLELMAME